MGEGKNYFYLIVKIIDARPVMLIPVQKKAPERRWKSYFSGSVPRRRKHSRYKSPAMHGTAHLFSSPLIAALCGRLRSTRSLRRGQILA